MKWTRTGLSVEIDPTLGGTYGDPSQFDHSGAEASGADGTWDNYYPDGNGKWKYLNTVTHGGLWDSMNTPMSGGSPGAGAGTARLAQSLATPQGAAAAAEIDAPTAGTLGRSTVTSDISGSLAKEAEAAGKSVQSGLDHLTSMLQKGAINAGKGFRSVQGVKNVLEMRAQDGARLYFRQAENGYEIVGKSAKFNQDKVINMLRGIYGK